MARLFKIIVFVYLLIMGMGNCCFASEAVLVVSNDNPLATISMRTAQLIFLGKKTKWESGEHIVVSVNNQEDVYSSVCEEILKKNPRQYLLYRKKMLFTGSGIPPLVKKDDEEVKAFLAEVKNGISFIDKKSLDSRVKELKIH